MEQALENDVHPPLDVRSPDDDVVGLDSVTLARLMAEVRNDEPVEANAYNRMHNRHNR